MFEYDNERLKYLEETNKLIDQVNLIVEVRKGFLNNINEICILMSELQDEICSDDSWLRLLEMNKINALLDKSLDYIWKMIYGKNRKKNEIKNIDIDKDKDIDEYVSKYMDIVNDKSELLNKIGELLNSIMIELQNVVETDNFDSLLKIIVRKKVNPILVRKKINPILVRKKIKPILVRNKIKPILVRKKKKPNTSEKKDKPNTSEKKDKLNTSERKDDIKKYNKPSKTLRA